MELSHVQKGRRHPGKVERAETRSRSWLQMPIQPVTAGPSWSLLSPNEMTCALQVWELKIVFTKFPVHSKCQTNPSSHDRIYVLLNFCSPVWEKGTSNSYNLNLAFHLNMLIFSRKKYITSFKPSLELGTGHILVTWLYTVVLPVYLGSKQGRNK